MVLDEAQDFLTNAKLDALNEMIRGGLEQGCWYVFLDKDHQADVYENFEEKALARLTANGIQRSVWRNCRNPSAIAMQTSFVCDAGQVRARVDGLPVDFHSYRKPESDDWLPGLTRILDELRTEDVPSGRISTLFLRTPHEQIPELERMAFGAQPKLTHRTSARRL